MAGEYNTLDIVEYKFSHSDTIKTALLTKKADDGFWALEVIMDDEGDFSWANDKINGDRIWLYPSDIIKVIG